MKNLDAYNYFKYSYDNDKKLYCEYFCDLMHAVEVFKIEITDEQKDKVGEMLRTNFENAIVKYQHYLMAKRGY